MAGITHSDYFPFLKSKLAAASFWINYGGYCETNLYFDEAVENTEINVQFPGKFSGGLRMKKKWKGVQIDISIKPDKRVSLGEVINWKILVVRSRKETPSHKNECNHRCGPFWSIERRLNETIAITVEIINWSCWQKLVYKLQHLHNIKKKVVMEAKPTIYINVFGSSWMEQTLVDLHIYPFMSTEWNYDEWGWMKRDSNRVSRLHTLHHLSFTTALLIFELAAGWYMPHKPG